MQKMIELECQCCKKKFERRLTEHKRCQKHNFRIVCSRSCGSKLNVKNNLSPYWGTNNQNLKTKLRDKYSKFRFFLRNCKQRNKDKGTEVNISLEYLKKLWEAQKGICPYTGWIMKCSPSLTYYTALPLTPDRASLDRIDSNKGYVEGNVEFVSFMAQCAKNVFNKEDVINFGLAISKEHQNLS